ncbi:MAG: SIR2 family protein [Desulfobulbaceae bacterium]|nr:SIR2 family protein [Desulfobulbaceae bacterium]
MNASLLAFSEELKNGKVFFFAGSGISYASRLPSAHDVLWHTIKALLPHLTNHQVNELCSIQPEVFYEVVLSVTGTTDSLHVWRSLLPETWKRLAIECKPNLAHIFIVEQSFKNSVPIFTTNFDTMFEMAAEELAIPYEILLPIHLPKLTNKSKLSICKLHGSIQDKRGIYTPDSLATTMTAISKINVPWVKQITELMEKAHLCFVGYSGRDVDLFPHIRDHSRSGKTLPIFWINRFSGCYSDNASKDCHATRIEDLYPEEVFKKIVEIGHLSSNSINIHSKIDPTSGNNAHVFSILSNELALKVSLQDEENIFLHALLQVKLSRFAETLPVFQRLAIDAAKSMRPELMCELLLVLSRLNHEVSRYESCGNYAKQALNRAKAHGKQYLNVEIQARILKCESMRMSIPADIYFHVKQGLMLKIFACYVTFSFLYTKLVIRLKMFQARKRFEKISPSAQQELLEHKIRFWGFLQSRWLIKSNRIWFRNLLGRIWNQLRRECQLYGYAGGIANTGKYYFRLMPERERGEEARNIFDLMTYSTGKELSIRNLADRALEKGSHTQAENLFKSLISLAQKSGNTLNEIKGLLGLAKVNSQSGKMPLLGSSELNRLKNLIAQIEGRFWRKFFNDLLIKYFK